MHDGFLRADNRNQNRKEMVRKSCKSRFSSVPCERRTRSEQPIPGNLSGLQTRETELPRFSLSAFAPDGFSVSLQPRAVGSYSTFSPLPATLAGVLAVRFSVALSVGTFSAVFACVYLRPDLSYAASRPVVFGSFLQLAPRAILRSSRTTVSLRKKRPRLAGRFCVAGNRPPERWRSPALQRAESRRHSTVVPRLQPRHPPAATSPVAPEGTLHFHAAETFLASPAQAC